MRSRDLLKTATTGVTVNKGRSLLTMLGIIIGVGSVVLMTGVGKSMEGVILGQISILGPKSMALWPGNEGPEGGPSTARSDFDALSIEDIEAMRSLKTITSIAPIIQLVGEEARYGREKMSPSTVGSTPEFYANQTLKVEAGRLHDMLDEQSARAVAVVGPDIVTELFFEGNAVGKRIDLAGRKFTVIGVLSPVGTQFFQNADNRIIIPFSTAQAIKQHNYIDMVTFQSVDDFEIAQRDVESFLRQRHGITAPPDGSTDNDDFLIRTAAQAADTLTTVSMGLTVFITMIAAVSLLVGGIGIMNIMLVSVTERTREIGLRKAVGAKQRDILLQFLIESVYLTLIGGVIGMAGGLFIAYIIALAVHRVLERYVFAVSPGAMVMALLMAAGTGLLFGIYPAKRAAELSPMEALRYE
jgi:putative ABC transport system permease protein